MTDEPNDDAPRNEAGRDDALDHLWNAAHEFLQAVRTLVDAADAYVTDQRTRPRTAPGEPRLRRIDIEDDDAPAADAY
jgi:hypothetical protein